MTSSYILPFLILIISIGGALIVVGTNKKKRLWTGVGMLMALLGMIWMEQILVRFFP